MSEDNTKLEEEFKAVVAEITPQINEQLDIARKAIQTAEKLAEQYGVPFSSDVSPLGQSYTPMSFTTKFGELDRDMVYDLVEVLPGGEYDVEGWEHSAVC